MRIEDIYPENNQKARGIYTPAKKIDMGECYLIFVSGRQAKKDSDHKIISGDIETQTEEIFENIESILNTAGATIDNVVKAVIYLTDMSNFKKVCKIRDKWFEKCKPVSTMVEISGTTRKGTKIEIEVTAIVEK